MVRKRKWLDLNMDDLQRKLEEFITRKKDNQERLKTILMDGQAKGLSLTELAEATGIPRSTVHIILGRDKPA